MNQYTLSYNEGDSKYRNNIVFTSSSDDTAKDYALNVLLKDKTVFNASLVRGKYTFRRSCIKCENEKQVMMIRFDGYECLDCFSKIR